MDKNGRFQVSRNLPNFSNKLETALSHCFVVLLLNILNLLPSVIELLKTSSKRSVELDLRRIQMKLLKAGSR